MPQIDFLILELLHQVRVERCVIDLTTDRLMFGDKHGAEIFLLKLRLAADCAILGSFILRWRDECFIRTGSDCRRGI